MTEDERAEKVTETFAAIGHMEVAFAKCSEGKAFFGGDFHRAPRHCAWLLLVLVRGGAQDVRNRDHQLQQDSAPGRGGSAEAKEVVPEAGEAVRYAHKLHAVYAAAAAAKVNRFGTSDWAMHHVRKETNKDIG